MNIAFMLGRLRPYRWVVTAALLGVLLSSITYQISQRQEKARLQAQFEHLANDRALRLQNSLDQALLVLTSTRGLFDASKQVSRQMFRSMVTPSLAHYPEIMAIEWAPKVRQDQRSAFERSLLDEELGNLGIYDIQADAISARKAEVRPVYFPLLFIEPMQQNLTAIGIDPYARPQNKVAMDTAMRLGTQSATPPFRIVQAPRGPLAAAIYQPVYRPGLPLLSPEQRQEALHGFLILLLRPAISLDAMLERQPPVGLDTRLLDKAHHPALIHHHRGRLPGTEVLPRESLRADFPLALPGRNLVMQVAATRGFRTMAGSNEPTTVLISGLSLSALLCLFLWSRARLSMQRQRLSEELQASENRLRQTFETNSAVKLIVDPSDGHIVDANSAACNYYGYRREVLLGMSADQINVLPKAEILAEMHLAEVEKRLYFNFRHRLASGELRDVEVYSGPIETPKGRLLYSIIHDVTERKRSELALLESESRFRQLAENVDAVFWINSLDWQQMIYISPAYERVWGRGTDSLYQNGMEWFEAVEEEDRQSVLEKIPALTDADWQSIEFPPYRIRRPDHSIRWIAARAFPVRDEQGRITRIAGIAEDITERQSYLQRLQDMAHFDPLTHLPNRRLLADRLQQSMARNHRSGQLLAICMLDLDSFKPVNDTFGHEVGDQLLIEVARRLQESLRGDDTVARLGGDEFVILLGGLDSVKELEEMMRRLLRILASPYVIAANTISVSASIGVTLQPNDSGDADTLLRHADHAMYLAKEAGKNRYHLFNPVLGERERDNRSALSFIKTAVNEDQLRLFYQPIVDCRRGMVVGMEALLRWEHPILGLMGPAEFLPLVEIDDTLAHNVGTWVLRSALRQADSWRQAGCNIPVSVNVFLQQLRDAEFPDQLQALLAEHPELPASRLCIEILESSAVDDFASVIRLINISASLGVRFALDDFGTGYSSLTYLRRLPVNVLKIDQTFVRDMLRDPDDLTIVEGVVGLGTAFHHEVIAEGVESADHVLMLMEMGCYRVQGFGIARPMPADQTLAWIKNFAPDPRWKKSAVLRLSRDDFQLVLAEVKHRQWLASLQDWMHQSLEQRPSPPPLDGRECNFGHWYYGEGHTRYLHLAEFRAVESVHERLHQLAQQLVIQTEAGEVIASRETETELMANSQAFRDSLVKIRTAVKHPDAGQ